MKFCENIYVTWYIHKAYMSIGGGAKHSSDIKNQKFRLDEIENRLKPEMKQVFISFRIKEYQQEIFICLKAYRTTRKIN